MVHSGPPAPGADERIDKGAPRPFQCICRCDKKFNGLAPRRFRDRWKDRLNVAGVKDSGSHGVFTILYVGVYTEADRNAVLDSRDNKLSNGTQYAGFR